MSEARLGAAATGRTAAAIVCVIAVVGAFVVALARPAQAAPLRPGQVPDLVTVGIDGRRAGPSSARALAHAASGTLVRVDGAGSTDPVAVVRVRRGQSAAASARLARDPRVAWAEPDTRLHAAIEPNDPCYQKTAACPGTGQVDQDEYKVMHAADAWSITRGSANVGVAVLDTRVDTTNIDLQGKVTTGPEFVTPDPAAPCPATTPFPDHGTHITGTIAAATDNNVGVAGLGWNTRVLVIRVLDDCGGGLASDIAQGIRTAVSFGARVLNLSLSGEGNRTLRTAITDAQAAGAVIVAAAGNDHIDPTTTTTPADDPYPALYPGVISVAATTRSDTLASFSDFGKWITVAAPGERIWSLGVGNTVVRESGTSMAVPHVTAVIALMLAVAPDLTANELIAKVKQTAVQIPGTGTLFAYGRVDAGAAVASAAFRPGQGYRLVASDGGIFAYGQDQFLGSTGGMTLNRPIVSAAPTPTGLGYWLAASDGGIFSFGDAGFYGSTGGTTLNKPIVAMASTPTGRGYWLTASDGGIFAFGDAGFFGSTGAIRLNQPIVGMAPTPTGAGYWLVASDGGIFSFGDAGFAGSTGGVALNKPIVGISPSRSGSGYRLVASDGGIFAFGDAGYFGSAGGSQLNRPIVGISATPSGKGYWLVASDGGIFAFGDAGFFGSTGGTRLNKPIIGIS